MKASFIPSADLLLAVDLCLSGDPNRPIVRCTPSLHLASRSPGMERLPFACPVSRRATPGPANEFGETFPRHAEGPLGLLVVVERAGRPSASPSLHSGRGGTEIGRQEGERETAEWSVERDGSRDAIFTTSAPAPHVFRSSPGGGREWVSRRGDCPSIGRIRVCRTGPRARWGEGRVGPHRRRNPRGRGRARPRGRPSCRRRL
jgi:hypothetical protein